MNNARHLIFIAVFAALIGLVGTVLAQQPYRLSDNEMKKLLEGIEKESEQFREALKKGLKNSRLDLGRGDDNIYQFVEDFEVSTKRLKDRFNNKRSVAADVEEVLRRAGYVDRFMQRHPLVTRAEGQWASLRRDLDALAIAYNVSWQWEGPAERPSRLSDNQVKSLLDSIEGGARRYRESMKKALKNNRELDRQARDNINKTLDDFAKATDRLQDHFGDKSFPRDLEEVLRWAATIDIFMQRHRLPEQVQWNWKSLNSNLQQVARAYNVS